jgi:hypothetical protein
MDMRGSDIGLGIDQPERGVVLHMPLGKYPAQRTVAQGLLDVPVGMGRDAQPGNRGETHARTIVDHHPAVFLGAGEFGFLPAARNQRPRTHAAKG